MTRYYNNIKLPDVYDIQLEEQKIIKFWYKEHIFQDIQNTRCSSKEQKLSFHSGPVFPTGTPHAGHILNSIVKDVFTRYGHQKNRLVESRFGWDCHGLAVEYEVNKLLGIKSRDDIQAIGVENYNNECRKFVQQNAGKWKGVYERAGNVVDFTKDYQTMSTDYMEGVWGVFKQLYDKGLVYKDTKVLPYSSACFTHLSNFEAEQNCKEVAEVGWNISVNIVNSDEKLLIWTTTPWALVSNSAVRVNPKALYVKVKPTTGEVVYILSKNRLESVFKKPNEYNVLEEFLGKELKHLKYEPLFDNIPVSRDFRVLLDSSVSDVIGTGIIPLDEMVLESLKERGHVVNIEEVKYKKPYCWRSNTPLISRKLESWFIRVQVLVQQILKNNSNINWTSDTEKEHFTDWIKNHPQDWAVSRTQYWGTPIPIWSSPSGDEVVCVGSIKELKQLTGKTNITNLHREYIDWMVIPSRTKGNPPLRRVTDVFDCWFESGALPFVHQKIPPEAEFVAEGIDQTRGWFYSTLVLSTALSQSAPFRNVFATGLVQESDGSKISKRKHNHQEPMRLIEKYGADSLRLYLLSSPLVKCESFTIQEEGVENIAKDVIQPLYRIFYQCTSQLGDPAWINYGYVTNWYGFPNIIDEWIISCTESLLQFYDTEMKAYRLHTFVPRLIILLQQVENWYIPIRQPKKKSEAAVHRSSIILFNVIYRLCLMLAPFAPFIPEYIYQIHRPYIIHSGRERSIHAALLLPIDEKLIHKDLEIRVSRMQTVVEIVRALRSRHIIPIQYQINEVVVIHHNGDYLHDIELMKEFITNLLNARSIKVSDDYKAFGATLKLELSPNSALSKNEKIKPAICDLSESDIHSLIQGKPVGVIKESDIQISYHIDRTLESNFALEAKDDLIVVIEMKKSLSYYEEGAVKEISNRLRNLKKKGNYFPNQMVTIYYSTESNCLQNLMVKHGEQLNRTINCDLRLSDSKATVNADTNSMEETVHIKGLQMKLHF